MIKCVAWDLDNTIWDGYADEDNVVALKPGIEELLFTLKDSGIVNAIISKNSRNMVDKLIEHFGLSEVFTTVVSNWKRKYSNIIELGKELNISLDSILFVDDSEFELQEAKYYLPSIKILNAEHILDIYDIIKPVENRTKESKARNYIYKILKKRKKDEECYVGSKSDFLTECNINIKFRDAFEEDVPRIFELSNRTNQFNINHNRIHEIDVIKFLHSDEYIVKVCQMKDRYADYGIVGMAILESKEKRLFIKHFAVSCKVEGRGVGKCFLSYLIKYSISNGYNELSSNCVLNEKNQEMKFLLKNLEFTLDPSDDSVFIKKKLSIIPYDSWLKVDEVIPSVLLTIREILGNLVADISKIDDDDDLLKQDIIDSITAISLITALEERFNISVGFDELKMINFSTISKITAFVEKKLDMRREKNELH